MEIGRVCVKLTGREAGNKFVIVEKIDKNFVMISSPTAKKRRCNMRHLEPLDIMVDIKDGASSKELEKALKKVKAI